MMDGLFLLYVVGTVSAIFNAFSGYRRDGLDGAMGWGVASLLFITILAERWQEIN